jgi:head-tail adaptor
MRSGSLRHSVIVQQPNITAVDGVGHVTEAWTEFVDRRFSIKPLQGRELEVISQKYGEVSHELRGRWQEGITPDMRLLWRRTHTTLSSAIASTGETDIGVNSGANFPRQGDFRIRVQDELMTVTAGQGASTWTVSRATDDSSPTTHDSATDVHQVVIADIVAVVDVNERDHSMLIYATEQA